MMHFISLHITKIRAFLYVLIAIYVYGLGAIFEPDTGSYLHLSIITSPGYPSFLYGFKKVFGEVGLGPYVITIQLIWCIFSVFYFSRTLKRIFGVRVLPTLLIEVILLLPIFLNDYHVVNRIVSEGLAYPLFIITISLCLKVYIEKDKKAFWILLASLLSIILIRAQFYFMLPVLVLVSVFLLVLEKDFKRHVFLILFYFLVPIVASTVDKLYHYAITGEYTSTANTGVQIMALPFFVSDENDYMIYKDYETQEYFKNLYKYAKESKVLDDYFQPKFNYDKYHYFHYHYIDLSFGILSTKGREFINPEDPDHWNVVVENNKRLIDMYPALIWQNAKKSLDLYFKNIKYASGGWTRFLTFLLVLMGGGFYYYKSKDILAFLAMLFAALTLSNIFLVCLVEHSIPRYFMYTQWMLPVLILLLLNRIFLKNQNSISALA